MTSWRDYSRCADLPWDKKKFFFAEGTVLPTYRQHEYARVICYACPVQIACLRECIDTDTDFGVWGGLTESQRKRYLWPSLREFGDEDWVLVDVVLSIGDKILKQIEITEREQSLPLDYPRPITG